MADNPGVIHRPPGRPLMDAFLSAIPMTPPFLVSPFGNEPPRQTTVELPEPPPPWRSLDRLLHALMGRATGGISPAALALAYFDWWVHLAIQPGKQTELMQKAARKAVRFGLYAARSASQPNPGRCIEPLPQDHRFDGPDWQPGPSISSTRASC